MLKEKFPRLVLSLLLMVTAGVNIVNAKESIIYGGGPFYNKASEYCDLIRSSGFTTVMLWTIHLNANCDMNYNDDNILKNGVYTGKASWPDEVKAFKEGETSVRRIELAIGAWNSDAFLHIKNLIAAEGTGPDSRLYKNFKLIHDLFPAIDGISYDDEKIYDVSSTVDFTVMLSDIGFKVTLCPYTRSDYWGAVYSQVNDLRPGAIDRVDLQCYAGGGWNTPAGWSGVFGDLQVAPGLWCYPNDNGDTPSSVASKMTNWNNSNNISGGFMWLFDDMLSHQGQYPIADYGWAINNALEIDPWEDHVLTLYQHCPYYHGWSADIGVGAYTAADIVRAGGKDNDASSFVIDPGYKVTFYSEDNFQGNRLEKTSDVSCLVDDGWNDVVSSLVVEPVDEPLGLWRFNDGGGTVVTGEGLLGGNGELKEMGEESWVVGRECGGLSFDGIDDVVSMDGFDGVAGHLSRSCCAWVKMSNGGGQIMSWGDFGLGRKWVVRTNNDGTLRAEVQGGSISGTTNIADGKWHYIAVTLADDGSPNISEAKLYVDGLPEVIGGVSGYVVNTGPGNVCVGVFEAWPSYFAGSIDEVSVYNRVLADDEIFLMYSEKALPGDLYRDDIVDVNDLSIMVAGWLNGDGAGDVTCDGVIDLQDIAVLSEQWLGELE